MSRISGIALAMASVGLVSVAQLGMRWSMLRLPTPEQWPEALSQGLLQVAPLAVVGSAILAYGLSMLCWLLALRELPLSRAYSLLSLSYALVYLIAACLPFFHEAFTVSRTVGVSLIVAGVLTINFRRTPRNETQDLTP
jgi:undecaprenyl phosphate-alpha-L-ara4N flippase subunit ArnF